MRIFFQSGLRLLRTTDQEEIEVVQEQMKEIKHQLNQEDQEAGKEDRKGSTTAPATATTDATIVTPTDGDLYCY